MKKLTRDELKKVSGGSAPEARCTTKCFTSSGGSLSCIKGVTGDCYIDANCSNASTCK